MGYVNDIKTNNPTHDCPLCTKCKEIGRGQYIPIRSGAGRSVMIKQYHAELIIEIEQLRVRIRNMSRLAYIGSSQFPSMANGMLDIRKAMKIVLDTIDLDNTDLGIIEHELFMIRKEVKRLWSLTVHSNG